jgi:hypothetical protein
MHKITAEVGHDLATRSMSHSGFRALLGSVAGECRLRSARLQAVRACKTSSIHAVGAFHAYRVPCLDAGTWSTDNNND